MTAQATRHTSHSSSAALPFVLQPVDRVPDDSNATAHNDGRRSDCPGDNQQGTTPLVLAPDECI